MRWLYRILSGAAAASLVMFSGTAALAATPAAFTVSNGTYTVAVAGTDIYGNADSFVYVYAGASGDGTWSVELNSVQNSVAWTKVGLMVRSSLSAGSPMLLLMNGSQNGDWLVDRTTSGGSVSTVNGGMSVSPPVWFQIKKTGTTFYAFDSANGTAWNLVGTPVTLDLGSNYYVGIAASEHTATQMGSATLSHLVGFTPTAGQGIGVSGIEAIGVTASTSSSGTATTSSTSSSGTATTSSTSSVSASASTSSASSSTAASPSAKKLPKTGASVLVNLGLGVVLLGGGGLFLVFGRKELRWRVVR